MESKKFFVRAALPQEYEAIGQLMVNVYSRLEGFPSPQEQPAYYQMLANVGTLKEQGKAALLVAVTDTGAMGGAVVYFSDMKNYGSGGTATQEVDAAGFRLLAVDPATRGLGLGKMLVNYCIEKAKAGGSKQLIIHTTQAMQTAWKMYEQMGFRRSEDLDFMQGQLPVFGFRLPLQ